MINLKDKAAIVGIGETQYSKNSGLSDLALQLQAATRAIHDSGLNPKDIDGVIPSIMACTAEDFATNLGIEDLKYSSTIHWGGSSSTASLQTAAMAVACGIANNVLCVTGWNGYSGMRVADMSDPNKSQAGGVFDLYRTQFELSYGWLLPVHFYAAMCQRHMYEYGTTSQQLGAISVAMRKHALLNDNAIMKKPITIDDHQNSRMISEPFHLFDCCIESDGGAAVVVSSAERANDMRHSPVYIMGVAEGHPSLPEEIPNRPDMTSLGMKNAAPRAFSMAGITPKDIDVAEIYDCFTWILLCQLEDIGFCEKGEGGLFVENGRIELGGELPVNTHGGLLSEAHILGMNHIVEAVKQLRGDAGERQVMDAEIALTTGFGDPGDCSIAILRR